MKAAVASISINDAAISAPRSFSGRCLFRMVVSHGLPSRHAALSLGTCEEEEGGAGGRLRVEG